MYFSVNPYGLDANLPRICILNGAISSFLLLLFFPFLLALLVVVEKLLKWCLSIRHRQNSHIAGCPSVSTGSLSKPNSALLWTIPIFKIQFSLFRYCWYTNCVGGWKFKKIKIRKIKTISQKSRMAGKKTRTKNRNWIAIPPKRDVKPPKIDFLLFFASPFPSHDLISMWSTPSIGEC